MLDVTPFNEIGFPLAAFPREEICALYIYSLYNKLFQMIAVKMMKVMIQKMK